MNITDPIRYRARLRPTAVAVIRADDTSVTYRDLDQMIDAATARVAGLGLRIGQVAGLTMAGPDEFLPLVLALALARVGITSADAALPADRLDVCLLPEGTAAPDGVRCVRFDASWIQPAPRGNAPAQPMHPDGSAICRIFASSGTTGTPKFTAISHDLIARRVFSNGLSMGPPEPIHICAVGFGITWGFCSVLRTFWNGGTLVLTNPAQAVAAIRRHQVNSMVIAPVSLRAVVSALPGDSVPPPSLRSIEVGGSLLPPRLHELVRQTLCGSVVSYFGSTETGGIASGPWTALQGIEGAVGIVHAGVEVQAVDADDRLLPHGTAGVLRIRGANTVTGYLDEAVAPTGIFRRGWFYPGDVGAVTADGIVSVTGRVSDFINAGGVKISPKVIEDVLLAVPDVTEAVAFGVPDRMGVVQIWAAIVAPVTIPHAVLTAACRENLGRRAPKFVLQIRELPRNANGKVLRDELVAFATAQQP